MSDELGIDLWIKRDDLTGFAMGGNKGRKLEYMMADAIDKKAEAMVTCGALQSNFIRHLGAACSRFGLKCGAVAMSFPYDGPAGKPTATQLRTGGNVLLDRILGVDLRIMPDGVWEELYEATEQLALEYERQGLKVYRVPIGGSSPLGAYAFYKAAQEVSEQAPPFDWIVAGSSSGSTQTGLTYGFHGTQTKVLGILADPEPEIVHEFAELAQGLEALAQRGIHLKASDFNANVDFVDGGYGVPSEAGNKAIEHMARTEGIFLDPTYSGKAFAGLMSLAKSGEIGGTVLFWHTGGMPALWATP